VKRLVLLCGLLCVGMGVVLLLAHQAVENAVWFGVPITVGGAALVCLALLPPRAPTGEQAGDAPAVPRPPGRWYPVVLLLIGALLVVYLLWWSKAGR
jgi:hypothetical protein